LAHHFRHSEVHEKAIDYSIRAADAAKKSFAYDLACAHLEGALARSAAFAIDPAVKAKILYKLGNLRFYFFGLAQGIEDMEAALRIRQSLGNRSEMLECRVWLGLALAVDGPRADMRRALAHLEAAESLATDDAVPELRAVMFWAFSVTYELLLRVDNALAANQKALEVYEHSGFAGTSEWVHTAKDRGELLMVKGRIAESDLHCQRVLSVASGLNDPDAFAWASSRVARTRFQLGNPREAARLLEQILGKAGLAWRTTAVLSEELATALVDL